MTPIMVAITSLFIAFAILLWDAYLYSDNTPRNAISQVIIDYSKKSSLVPALIGLFVGILFGHWWG